MAKEEEILIVGGGLCGLATALALHRKGIRSVVLERSTELRARGGAIGIRANGWRALDQLGLASALRLTAHHMEGGRDIWLDKGINKPANIGTGESRCLRRTDLIVLIGCDGSKSVVADFLNLSPVKDFGLMAVRGLTTYPNGHAFAHEFLRIRKNNILVGTIPVDDKAMYWFVALESSSYKGINSTDFTDPEEIRNLAVESIKGFPIEIMQMFEAGDLDTLSLTRLRYRSPWALLLGNFRKGTVTVAGDAMHVMGPFLGQGGSAALKDAIVLARCLSQSWK